MRSLDAVRAWLTEHQGTVPEIIAGTGFSLCAVERAIRALRESADPALGNFIRRPSGRPLEGSRKKVTPLALNAMVRTALQTRTPLEEAWR